MKLIYSILIMFIVFIPMFTGFHFLDVWVHENAHVAAAKDRGVNFYISKFNYKLDLKNPNEWGTGATQPSTKEDCEKFNSLSLVEQKAVTHAGVIREMIIFVPLFLILFLILMMYGKNIYSTNLLLFILLIMFLIGFEVIIINSIYGNVFLHFLKGTSNPTDWYVSNFSNCPIYG